ncbi:MAG: hypothetical protein Q7V20_13905 [Aquabacterium sp.]|uniref:hypothetical protein n=1 Tax=Aquabacterium sp. TaxID=1872578 RepID=UPI0027245318|nr:hypothetical protein [Aquabacterium sp.]MDO9004538.1 hypothetical protein [Aquabacterium sp.]
MWIVAIAWMFVVMLMTVAEAVSPVGSVLGAIVTFFLYGVGPLALVMYLLGTPMRRQARRAKEAAEDAQASRAVEPDAGGLPPSDTVTPERKEA